MAATRLFALKGFVAAVFAVAVSVSAAGPARATESASDPITERDKTVAPSATAAPVPSRSVTTKFLPTGTTVELATVAPIPDRNKAPGAQAEERVIREMTGVASWYGPGFHGRRTANGERFNQNELTAAHKTLPFNTRVRVTSMATNRSVIVTINDRGPYVRGRAIDLSAAAARSIGLETRGVGRVKIEVLGTPVDVAHQGGSRPDDTREAAAVPRKGQTVVATE